MKKVLILALLVPLFSFGQKISFDGKDKFTGEHIKETTLITLKSGWDYWLGGSVKVVDNVAFVNFSFSQKSSLKISPGSTVYISLSNGNTVKLQTETASAEYEDNTATGLNSLERRWMIKVSCKLNKNDINVLKEGMLSAIRFDTEGHPIVFEKIRKHYGKEFQKSLELAGL